MRGFYCTLARILNATIKKLLFDRKLDETSVSRNPFSTPETLKVSSVK